MYVTLNIVEEVWVLARLISLSVLNQGCKIYFYWSVRFVIEIIFLLLHMNTHAS